MAARSSRLRPSAASQGEAAARSDARGLGFTGERDQRPGLDVARLLTGRTRVMGVVNVTPDSFHQNSRTADRETACAAALAQLADGADVLDLGGESTRPGATPVVAEVEIARVVPVVAALVARGFPVPISIDTYKADVARAAVAAGATIVNDVSGGLLDARMAATVAELGVAVIVGHLRGNPQTMTAYSAYDDVVAEVRDELAARVEGFLAAGVDEEQILVDPGIGFAKGARANYALLRRLDELAVLGRPLVVGLSRKQFIGEAMRSAGLEPSAPEDRLAGSLAAAVLAASRGAAVVRTHDVAETRRALAIADAILHEA